MSLLCALLAVLRSSNFTVYGPGSPGCPWASHSPPAPACWWEPTAPLLLGSSVTWRQKWSSKASRNLLDCLCPAAVEVPPEDQELWMWGCSPLSVGVSSAQSSQRGGVFRFLSDSTQIVKLGCGLAAEEAFNKKLFLQSYKAFIHLSCPHCWPDFCSSWKEGCTHL